MKKYLIRPTKNGYVYEYSLIGIYNKKPILVTDSELSQSQLQRMINLNLVEIKELPEQKVKKNSEVSAKTQNSKKKSVLDNKENDKKVESGISESPNTVISNKLDKTDATVESNLES